MYGFRSKVVLMRKYAKDVWISYEYAGMSLVIIGRMQVTEAFLTSSIPQVNYYFSSINNRPMRKQSQCISGKLLRLA